MNAPREPWADFCAEFAEDINAKPLTAEELQKLADEYQRDAIDGAQSDAAQDALRKEFNK